MSCRQSNIAIRSYPVPVNAGRGGDLERHPVGHPGGRRALAGDLDRGRVVVRADERGVRERLRQQDRRRAVAAADVGDLAARLELRRDAVERGDPLGEQVPVVHRAEEALTAVVDVGVVLVPADAVAVARRLVDALGVVHGAQRQLEEAGQVRRARRVRERDGVLGGQRVPARLGVVLDDSRPRPGCSATRGRSARSSASARRAPPGSRVGRRPSPCSSPACRPSRPARCSGWRRPRRRRGTRRT